MIIAEDKKKLGKDYIPPIYCRFVNRSVANLVLKRRHLLKNAFNNRGQKYSIEENLTLPRRIIRKKAASDLHSFKYQWVKNGKVFVKKYKSGKAIHLISEAVLDNLIDQQNTVSTEKRKETTPLSAQSTSGRSNSRPLSHSRSQPIPARATYSAATDPFRRNATVTSPSRYCRCSRVMVSALASDER